MNPQTQNEIPEYVKNLPQAVQDLIFDGTWEERTGEVAKKYSLNPTQTDNLINTVLFVLIGLEKPETFLSTIMTDIGISQLLAEQIMGDLEGRVFEYALSRVTSSKQQVIRKEEVSPQVNPTQETVSRTGLDTTSSEQKSSLIPEIYPVRSLEGTQSVSASNGVRPGNLPVVEKKSEYRPIQTPVSTPSYKPTSSVPNNLPGATPVGETSSSLASFRSPTPSPGATPIKPTFKISEIPKIVPLAQNTVVSKTIFDTKKETTEPVQRPLNVPRFTPVVEQSSLRGATAVPMEEGRDSISKTVFETNSEENVSKAPLNDTTPVLKNIIDTKLTNVTSGMKDIPVQKEKLPESEAVRKYNLDPYREPLE